MVQLHRLHAIYNSAGPRHLPHKLDIGPEHEEQPEDDKENPSLALVLSTLGLHLQQAGSVNIRTPCHDAAGFVKQLEAPPRFETAISALLRPLHDITLLNLHSVIFRSLTQLLRIIRGLPQIQHIDLSWITVMQASENLYWPASLALTELQEIKMCCCFMPASAISAFISLAFRGKPNLMFESPTRADIVQYCPRRFGDGYHDYSHRIHHDDAIAVLQIVQALGRHLCTPLNHTNDSAKPCMFEVMDMDLDMEVEEPRTYLSGEVC